MTLIEKIEQAADKYTDNAGNFIEYSDDGGWSDKNDIEYVEKAYKVGAEYGYNLAVEKAVDWLCMNMVDTLYIGCTTHRKLGKAEFILTLKRDIKL